MGDSCCRTRLKYLDQFLRYFGKIFFEIFTNSVTLWILLIELNYKKRKGVAIPFEMRCYKHMFENFWISWKFPLISWYHEYREYCETCKICCGGFFKVPTHKIWSQYLNPVPTYGQNIFCIHVAVGQPSWIRSQPKANKFFPSNGRFLL